MYEEKRNAYRVLVGKPKGKSPLGRPKYRCQGNNKMDLKENMTTGHAAD
jgi:hypothetical protein